MLGVHLSPPKWPTIVLKHLKIIHRGFVFNPSSGGLFIALLAALIGDDERLDGDGGPCTPGTAVWMTLTPRFVAF